MSSEDELKEALDAYQQQLNQIEAMLLVNQDDIEIQNLKYDLEEIIKLTKESLLEVKRKNLLAELDKLAGITENVEQQPTTSSQSNNENNNFDDDDDDDDDLDLSEIIGSKCRIPFNCTATDVKMHNAIVLGVSSLENNTVDVIFLNPTQKSLKVCDYFLEGNCKFGDDCKFSHGFEINVDKLESYKESNLNDIKEGKLCLAKYPSDGIWYLATIESIDFNEIYVQFKQFNKTELLSFESICVIEEDESESSAYNENNKLEEDVDNDEIISKNDFEPRNLNSSISMVGNIGGWEKYTRGIGSKLLSKMGYIPGKGLGSKGEGRLEPIDVYVLPAGKSLDKIMELKEKKLLKKEKFKPKIEKPDAASEINVFEFINKTLSKKETSKKEKSEIHINNQTTKNLKIEMLKTHEEIQNIEKIILKLKQSLDRNKNSDKVTINNIKQKLLENEKKLENLRKFESKIKNEQTKRKDKFDIF